MKLFHNIQSPMRKNWWFLIPVCIILITACNLPSIDGSNSQADPSVVAAVDQTLTANPPLQPSQPPPSTEVPTAIASISPSPAFTSTPLPTTTLLASPSATPQNWKAALGNPTMKDTLDSGNGFGLQTPYSDDYVTFSVSDGQMTAQSVSTNGWNSWRLRPPKIQNFYLEGQFKTVNCSGNDHYGLVFRAPDYESGQGYYYSVSCDGNFAFSVWNGNETKNLVPKTFSTAIRSGPGQNNTLGIMAKDNNFTLYINDQLISEITDGSLPSSGYYGIFIGGSSGSLTVLLDEIAYWSIP